MSLYIAGIDGLRYKIILPFNAYILERLRRRKISENSVHIHTILKNSSCFHPFRSHFYQGHLPAGPESSRQRHHVQSAHKAHARLAPLQYAALPCIVSVRACVSLRRVLPCRQMLRWFYYRLGHPYGLRSRGVCTLFVVSLPSSSAHSLISPRFLF